MTARRRIHGWTLTEIMIVMVLIGLLAAIAIPSLRKARNTSQRKEAEAKVHMLGAAIRQLVWDTGKWPGGTIRTGTLNAEVWDLTAAAAGVIAADNRFSNWKGPYIPSIDLDPWGQPYFFDPDYRVNGQMRVVVGSFGPNKRGRNVYDDDNIYILLDDK